MAQLVRQQALCMGHFTDTIRSEGFLGLLADISDTDCQSTFGFLPTGAQLGIQKVLRVCIAQWRDMACVPAYICSPTACTNR